MNGVVGSPELGKAQAAIIPMWAAGELSLCCSHTESGQPAAGRKETRDSGEEAMRRRREMGGKIM